MRPFSEANLFEQNNNDDPFYATGSIGSIGETPGSFSSALQNKDQIKLSFSILEKTQMLPKSSSIYYLNIGDKKWNIPSSAQSEHKGPFQNFAFKTQWSPASGTSGASTGYTIGSKFLEDYKGFDPYGRPMASGSANIYRHTLTDSNQTIEGIGQLTTTDTNVVIPFLFNDYPNSVQRSSIYNATQSECFELELEKPFLLEKFVCEIPITLGENWFKDLTTTSFSHASGYYAGTQATPNYGYFDRGGPAITISLMCQKKYGQETIRDLIASQVITHEEDAKGNTALRTYPDPYTEGGVQQPLIMLAACGLVDPSVCIVQRPENLEFTGSITIKLTPTISNGSSAIFNSGCIITGSIDPLIDVFFPGAVGTVIFTESMFQTYLSNFFAKEKISTKEFVGGGLFLGLLAPNVFTVTNIDPFGRGMTGFSPSGGSIFGGEYATPQNPTQMDNPFYIKNDNTRQEVITEIISQLSAVRAGYGFIPTRFDTTWINFIGDSNYFVSKKQSPYLINPGDKLLLTVSKTRPAAISSQHNVPDSASAEIGYQTLISLGNVTGSYLGHDSVYLNTGSVNMSFYGSYVRAGNSYTP
jgi:hypothetical protein